MRARGFLGLSLKGCDLDVVGNVAELLVRGLGQGVVGKAMGSPVSWR